MTLRRLSSEKLEPIIAHRRESERERVCVYSKHGLLPPPEPLFCSIIISKRRRIDAEAVMLHPASHRIDNGRRVAVAA